MTALVGIRCKDGIVIGSDSSATFGNQLGAPTIEQACKKVDVINGETILSGTGSVGLHQRFREIVTKYFAEKQWRGPNQQGKTATEIVKELCLRGLQDFGSTGQNPGNYGALFALPAGGKFHLCEFAIKDFQPEFKEDGGTWFASMGSGQAITDPFMGMLRRVFWKTELPYLNEGIFAATWTLDHVIKLNPGGINGPPQIAVLQNKDGKLTAHILDDAQMFEHTGMVDGAEKHLAKFRDVIRGSGAQRIPERN